jgi:putative chitinase
MQITEKQLKQIVPSIYPENLRVYTPLLNSLNETSIKTFERFCCFLAQTAHESGAFNYTREIASGKAYEGRKDLGNIYPGDGVKFKGRGLIQVTGRSNYEACSIHLFGDKRLLEKPGILEQPEYALKSAVWYWGKNRLNEICDYSDNWTLTQSNGRIYNKFQYLTKKINGGLTGYKSRLDIYNKAREVIK